MMENKFRVWCEFKLGGKIIKSMEESASWFMITQTGKLYSYGPTTAPQPVGKEYKVAIPLFYTGLKDKNNIEIYRGDIISADGMLNDLIVFKDGGFNLSGGESTESLLYQLEYYGNYKVIGNMYENPELLERK